MTGLMVIGLLVAGACAGFVVGLVSIGVATAGKLDDLRRRDYARYAQAARAQDAEWRAHLAALDAELQAALQRERLANQLLGVVR
jgi:hypothetical protein